MAVDKPRKVARQPVSLLLCEGDSEMVFFQRVKDTFFPSTSYRVKVEKNLKGNFNINEKVIDKIIDFAERHRDEKIRAYCCIDRESRNGAPPGFDLNVIEKNINDRGIVSVLSIDVIVAVQQIESWYFYDIEGIFKFIGVPRARRNPRNFQPPEKFGYKDLQRLFESNGRYYSKGKRSKNFINNLDVDKIASGCKELRAGIELIQSQSSISH